MKGRWSNRIINSSIESLIDDFLCSSNLQQAVRGEWALKRSEKREKEKGREWEWSRRGCWPFVRPRALPRRQGKSPFPTDREKRCEKNYPDTMTNHFHLFDPLHFSSIFEFYSLNLLRNYYWLIFFQHYFNIFVKLFFEAVENYSNLIQNAIRIIINYHFLFNWF